MQIMPNVVLPFMATFVVALVAVLLAGLLPQSTTDSRLVEGHVLTNTNKIIMASTVP